MGVSLSQYAGAGAQFFDNNGNPLSGGLIYTYAAGTTTEVATYTSSSGGTANANPIVLDSAGRTPAQIWLTEGSSYKFVLQTSLNVTIKTDDNIFASYELATEVGVVVNRGGNSVNTNTAVGGVPGSPPTGAALASNTTGSNNTAVGYNAMTANTDGFQNTAVGSEALDANTSGDYNTGVGYQALTAASTANYNTGIGYRALQATTTGAGNTAVGSDALLLTSTGADNVAVGYGSLDAYTGSDAVAIGRSALGANTSGTGNTAVGKDAALLVVTGAYNVAVGWTALDAATTSNNTAVGASALGALTSGANNVALGFQAGDALTTGSNNLVLGYDADVSAAGVSNEITLGNASVTSMRVPGLTLTFSVKYFNHGTLTVATLPAAATAGAGARAVVTDANATTFHSIVAGGGANVVPVFSDGTNWQIG
jgi:hypothetical protein